MTRVGVTQRVEEVAEYDERRDCLDQRWTPLLVDLGFEPILLPNRLPDATAFVERLDVDALVLTGGSDVGGLPGATGVAPERDAVERELVAAAAAGDLPVFGVCRGLQLLNLHFGGQVRPVDGHVDVTHEVDVGAVEAFGESVTVNSYHSYGFDRSETAPPFSTVGTAPDDTVEVAVHDSLPIRGVMWHPERGEPAGETLEFLGACLRGEGP